MAKKRTAQKSSKPTMTEADAAHNAAGQDSKSFQPRLLRPHPLIAQAAEKPPKPDRWGYTPVDHRPKVDMNVSKEQKRLAMIVLDRLFKALEREGMEVAVLNDQRGRGTFAIDGHDRAPVSISERTSKVPHTPTPEEIADQDSPFRRRIPKFDSVFTGVLELNPGGIVDLSSEEALEAVVAKSVEGVKAAVAVARERRTAEQKRQREEWERQAAKRRAQDRVDSLHKSAEALDRYRKLMAYIEEVRQFGEPPADQRIDGQTLEEWLKWAEWQARIIHPLS